MMIPPDKDNKAAGRQDVDPEREAFDRAGDAESVASTNPLGEVTRESFDAFSRWFYDVYLPNNSGDTLEGVKRQMDLRLSWLRQWAHDQNFVNLERVIDRYYGLFEADPENDADLKFEWTHLDEAMSKAFNAAEKKPKTTPVQTGRDETASAARNVVESSQPANDVPPASTPAEEGSPLPDIVAEGPRSPDTLRTARLALRRLVNAVRDSYDPIHDPNITIEKFFGDSIPPEYMGKMQQRVRAFLYTPSSRNEKDIEDLLNEIWMPLYEVDAQEMQTTFNAFLDTLKKKKKTDWRNLSNTKEFHEKILAEVKDTFGLLFTSDAECDKFAWRAVAHVVPENPYAKKEMEELLLDALYGKVPSRRKLEKDQSASTDGSEAPRTVPLTEAEKQKDHVEQSIIAVNNCITTLQSRKNRLKPAPKDVIDELQLIRTELIAMKDESRTIEGISVVHRLSEELLRECNLCWKGEQKTDVRLRAKLKQLKDAFAPITQKMRSPIVPNHEPSDSNQRKQIDDFLDEIQQRNQDQANGAPGPNPEDVTQLPYGEFKKKLKKNKAEGRVENDFQKIRRILEEEVSKDTSSKEELRQKLETNPDLRGIFNDDDVQRLWENQIIIQEKHAGWSEILDQIVRDALGRMDVAEPVDEETTETTGSRMLFADRSPEQLYKDLRHALIHPLRTSQYSSPVLYQACSDFLQLSGATPDISNHWRRQLMPLLRTRMKWVREKDAFDAGQKSAYITAVKNFCKNLGKAPEAENTPPTNETQSTSSASTMTAEEARAMWDAFYEDPLDWRTRLNHDPSKMPKMKSEPKKEEKKDKGKETKKTEEKKKFMPSKAPVSKIKQKDFEAKISPNSWRAKMMGLVFPETFASKAAAGHSPAAHAEKHDDHAPAKAENKDHAKPANEAKPAADVAAKKADDHGKEPKKDDKAAGAKAHH